MKKLKPHKVDWGQIDRFLTSADKKLASAHKILAFDEEACLQQTYEAMLMPFVTRVFTGRYWEFGKEWKSLLIAWHTDPYRHSPRRLPAYCHRSQGTDFEVVQQRVLACKHAVACRRFAMAGHTQQFRRRSE
jgi:hypothetical protein